MPEGKSEVGKPSVWSILQGWWSGWPTILKLTCWVCGGTHPSTWARKGARSHQVGELKQSKTEPNYHQPSEGEKIAFCIKGPFDVYWQSPESGDLWYPILGTRLGAVTPWRVWRQS